MHFKLTSAAAYPVSNINRKQVPLDNVILLKGALVNEAKGAIVQKRVYRGQSCVDG